MLSVADLSAQKNPLAAHYRRFKVEERLLLSGHSHQAWPDCALDGQMHAWLDAAEHIDDKWERASIVANLVRNGFKRLLNDSRGSIALGQNTHELVYRLLTALPLDQRPVIVTSDSEFHTLRRQLDRMAENRIELRKIAVLPRHTYQERLAAAVDNRCAAVMVSHTYYNSGWVAGSFDLVARACEKFGAVLLVDAYHSLNVLPFSLKQLGLENAYITGGGYKYCQLGEGNCFLRRPEHCHLRPEFTGWYSEFANLAAPVGTEHVSYGDGPSRFAGSTYDPTSHYRAAAVFDFFAEQSLTPVLLRNINQHQIALLIETFRKLDLPPSVIDYDAGINPAERGGFLALQTPHAQSLCQGLRKAGVVCDFRGSILRLGPAPYLADRQLNDAMAALEQQIKAL